MDYMKTAREVSGAQRGFREAQESGMPGLHNGPADAYRHVIGAAEMTRRYGETAARAMLQANEVHGDLKQNQPKEEREMDEHNNEIGVRIGKEAETYDEIVEKAREAIDRGAAHGGSGEG